MPEAGQAHHEPGGLVVRDLDGFRVWAARRLSGLAYVGPDPHHALGLASLVPGFAALSSRAPALAILQRGGADTLAVDSPDGNDAAALLQTADVAGFLNRRPLGCALFVFKPSHRIDEQVRANGWRLLASPAAVARRWENKIVFSSLATELDLRVPDFRIVGSSPEAAEALNRLGGDVIVQAPHGYAGGRSIRVSRAADIERAIAALRAPQLRVAQTVAGTPWTVNGCVTARGTAASAPTLQLTGVPCLTPRELGACGNDGTATCTAAPAMRAIAQRLGSAMAREGYLGFFGVDFVVDDDGPWVIEVNPRLVSSVGLATQAQVAAGKVPLIGRHFMALVEPDADGLELDDDAELLGASQIVLHNLDEHPRVVRRDLSAGSVVFDGGHDGTSAERSVARGLDIRPVAGLSDLPSDGWLFIPAAMGRRRAAGSEVARLQRRGSVAAADGRIRADAEEAARAAYAALDLG